MADWNSIDLDDMVPNGYNNNSRKSSVQSNGFAENKENNSNENISTSTYVNRQEVLLARGVDLSGESRTELSPTCVKNEIVFPESTTKQITQTADPGVSKSNKSTHASPPTTDPNPADSISIPGDGNISHFTHDQLATFLRYLKIDDRIISHLHRKQVNGKRFAKLKDAELDSLGIKNPVVVFFRNKSSVKGNGKGPFML